MKLITAITGPEKLEESCMRYPMPGARADGTDAQASAVLLVGKDCLLPATAWLSASRPSHVIWARRERADYPSEPVMRSDKVRDSDVYALGRSQVEALMTLRWVHERTSDGRSRSHRVGAWLSADAGSRRRRLWRWGGGVAAAALAVLAFLIWGPIGFGSGPLVVYAPSGGQLLGPSNRAWGLFVGIEAGNSGAVVDAVAVSGGSGYPGPHVLSLWTISTESGSCGGTWPWSGPDNLFSSCASGRLRPLIGQALPGNNPGVDMVLKIGPPVGTSGCWVATSLIVHYHVGIRHYTVTSSGSFAACKTHSAENWAAQALRLPT